MLTMEDRIGASLAKPRFYAAILAGFAVFALAISGVGLFGVLSYSVAQRSSEIAIRAALGARPLDIVRLVLKQGLRVTVCGVSIGVAAAAILVSYLSTFLYGISTYDPLTFVGVPLVLGLVATVACVLPSLSAARIDPIRGVRGA